MIITHVILIKMLSASFVIGTLRVNLLYFYQPFALHKSILIGITTKIHSFLYGENIIAFRSVGVMGVSV